MKDPGDAQTSRFAAKRGLPSVAACHLAIPKRNSYPSDSARSGPTIIFRGHRVGRSQYKIHKEAHI